MKRAEDNCALKFTEWKSRAGLDIQASGNHSLSLRLLNHQQRFKAHGYDERGLSTTNTLRLCNWQPWVITARVTRKLHKQEKTQQTIVKNIIPYHGVCLLSDKACVDSLRVASTHSLYSAADTLLLAGKTKSILKACLASVCVLMRVSLCMCVCVYMLHAHPGMY